MGRKKVKSYKDVNWHIYKPHVYSESHSDPICYICEKQILGGQEYVPTTGYYAHLKCIEEKVPEKFNLMQR